MAGKSKKAGDGLIVTIDAGDLGSAVSAVVAAAARKDTVPILTCIKFEVGKASATLTASNLDQEASVQIPAVVDGSGAVCVDARALAGIVGRMKGELLIAQRDRELELATGRYSAKLPVLPAEDFPVFPAVDGTEFEIASGVLMSGFASVRHCMSTEETRYYLNGVYIEPVAGELIFTATEGHRLATLAVTAGDVPSFPPAIVPRHALNDLMKLCERADGPVTVTVNDRMIEMAAKGECYRTKLIDMQYPDWRRVFPKSAGTEMALPRKELIDALAMVVSASRERSTAVKFQATEGRLTLTAGTSDGPRAEAIVEATDIPPCAPFGLNGKFVLQALEAFSSDEVTMTMTDAMGPVRFETGDALRQLVVPLRV